MLKEDLSEKLTKELRAKFVEECRTYAGVEAFENRWHIMNEALDLSVSRADELKIHTEEKRGILYRSLANMHELLTVRKRNEYSPEFSRRKSPNLFTKVQSKRQSFRKETVPLVDDTRRNSAPAISSKNETEKTRCRSFSYTNNNKVQHTRGNNLKRKKSKKQLHLRHSSGDTLVIRKRSSSIDCTLYETFELLGEMLRDNHVVESGDTSRRPKSFTISTHDRDELGSTCSSTSSTTTSTPTSVTPRTPTQQSNEKELFFDPQLSLSYETETESTLPDSIPSERMKKLDVLQYIFPSLSKEVAYWLLNETGDDVERVTIYLVNRHWTAISKT